MRRIAIALSKGGVGKTTTAVNLADGLARLGKKVLLIDVDTQGQVAKALNCTPVLGLANLIQREADFSKAFLLARENLWLLAGGRSMAGLKRVITRMDYGGEKTIAKALESEDGRFDYVLLDSGPGWDAITINVLFYVSEVLCPVSLEVLTLQGLMEFNASLDSLREYRKETELKYILPTFYDRRVKKSEEILKLLEQHFPGKVCSPIRYNVRLSEAPGYGQTIYEYAPRSAGAEDYQSLVERIVKDDKS